MKKTIQRTVALLIILLGILTLGIILSDAPRMQRYSDQTFAAISSDSIRNAKKANQDVNQDQQHYDSRSAKELTPFDTIATGIHRPWQQVKQLANLNAKQRKQLNPKTDYLPAGRLSIPAVDLKLPIGFGVNQSTLRVGAGTMKPDQQMGSGNYALAGHYTYRGTILFSPLDHIRSGNKIYLTDDKYRYEYRTLSKQVIKRTNVGVLNDIPGKMMITLITCTSTMHNNPHRLMVRGEFVKKTLNQ